MSKTKRYDHPNATLSNTTGHNGVGLPDGITVEQAAAELYARLGVDPDTQTLTVVWEPWSPAEPIVDTDTLPAGITESDVEAALTGMASEGVL